MLLFYKNALKPELRVWFLFIICLGCLRFDTDRSIDLHQYHFLAGKTALANYLVFQNSIPSQAYQHLAALKQLSALQDPKASLLLAQHYEDENRLDLSEFYYKQAYQITSDFSDQAVVSLSQFYQRHAMWQQLADFSQKNDLIFEWYLSQLQLGETLPSLPDPIYVKIQKKYHIDFTQRLEQLSFDPEKKCTIKVVPIASDLVGLQRLTKHIDLFKADNDLNVAQVCFSVALYLPKQQLLCVGNRNVKCDLNYLAQQKDWPEGVRHLIIMASDGAANVNQGIMYLSADSDFNVFKHEWLHLFGFEDEYPLAIEKQSQRCNQLATSLSQLIVHDTNLKPLDNIYPVATCNQLSLQAYKQVKEPTLMEYLDAGMPQSYKVLLRRNIEHHLGELKTFSNAMYNLTEDNYWLSYGAHQGDYYSHLLQALEFEEQGDVGSALNKLSLLTNWPIAYSSLARIYYKLENLPQARYFYQLAAMEGDSYGQYFYAKMLASGEGGPKDETAAKRYLNHAAAQSNPLAIQLINLAPF